MPTHPAKARKLLKLGKARPAKAKTGYFTVQLTYDTASYIQPVTVGVDLGSNTVPIAAIANGKVVYAKEKLLRRDISAKLKARGEYRRQRRGRLRHRKPRFDNRVKKKCARCGVNNVPRTWKKIKRQNGKSKKRVLVGRANLCRKCQGEKGLHRQPHLLPPSVKARADAILADIEKFCRSLPVAKIVVEIAYFDTQKMANPDIEGVEYQKGTLEGEEIRSYVFNVFKHKCAYCKGASGDKILEIDHVRPKSKKGSDKLSNLVASCRQCNIAKGSMTLDQWAKRLQASPCELDKKRLSSLKHIKKRSDIKKGFQYSALTQSYKSYLLHELAQRHKDKRFSTTYGYATKFARKAMGLEKSQINDAMVIASEGRMFPTPKYYLLERCLKKRRAAEYISPHKEGTPVVRRPWSNAKYGFRLWDKVEAEAKQGYVAALRESGSFRVHTLYGDKIFGGKSYKKLRLITECNSNYMREWKMVSQEPMQMELTFPA